MSRNFEATLGKDELIKAEVGNNNVMQVDDQIKDGASKIKLDGYCLFEGPLTKK